GLLDLLVGVAEHFLRRFEPLLDVRLGKAHRLAFDGDLVAVRLLLDGAAELAAVVEQDAVAARRGDRRGQDGQRQQDSTHEGPLFSDTYTCRPAPGSDFLIQKSGIFFDAAGGDYFAEFQSLSNSDAGFSTTPLTQNVWVESLLDGSQRAYVW